MLWLIGLMTTIKLVSGASNCSNDTEFGVRLTFRHYTEREDAGLLEICHSAEWGTVCEHKPWSFKASSVACRQLGFFDGYGIVLLQDASPFQLQPISRPKYGTDFECDGPEKNLAVCTHNQGIFKAPSSCTSAVWLLCNEMCVNGDVQLVGSHSESNGKVEFCYESSWWPICNLEIGLAEHMVICRQLGYFTGYHSAGVKGLTEFIFVRVIKEDFNSVTLNFKLDCNGNESNFPQCFKRGTFQYRCTGVEEQLHLVCIDAVEASNCSQGDIRLVGRVSTPGEGRLEICFNHMWGTVCNEGWDNTDATVACRQLGFESASTTASSNSIDEASGPIFITNVRCSSTSINKLSECPFDDHHITVSRCNHRDDVYLTCISKDEAASTTAILGIMGGVVGLLLFVLSVLCFIIFAQRRGHDHSSNTSYYDDIVQPKAVTEAESEVYTHIQNPLFSTTNSQDTNHTYEVLPVDLETAVSIEDVMELPQSTSAKEEQELDKHHPTATTDYEEMNVGYDIPHKTSKHPHIEHEENRIYAIGQRETHSVKENKSYARVHRPIHSDKTYTAPANKQPLHSTNDNKTYARVHRPPHSVNGEK